MLLVHALYSVGISFLNMLVLEYCSFTPESSFIEFCLFTVSFVRFVLLVLPVYVHRFFGL